MDPIYWQLALQVMLIALNAVFACAEIAVLSFNDTKLAHLASQGNKKAIRLARLTNQPARFLATIQVAITLSGFLGSAFAAENFSDQLASWLVGVGVSLPLATLDTICLILITLVLSYFTLVFGELVPKRIAMKNAEKLALGMSSLISLVSKIFSPIVWLLTISTNAILRLFGIDPHSADDAVSEEEILMMVESGSESGSIDSDEREFIQNIFDFDDIAVEEFATHRTDVTILWMDETDEEWEKSIQEARHSRYPVCDETIDNVIGILNIKDYYSLKIKTRENILLSAVRPAYFIPESTKADVLFRQMRKSRNHIAVVLDEYGGMSGLITMSDLLEQLVGDLPDADDGNHQEPDIVPLDSGTWRIHGSADLDEVAKALKIELPLDEFDTFGGFVFGSYGTYPDDGIQFEVEAYGLHIKVIEIKSHRIERAIVCKIEPNDGDDKADD